MAKAKAPAKPRTLLPWQLPLPELQQRPDAIMAIKAFAEGRATAEQQMIAYAFIRERLCGCGTMSFWPGGEDGRRATDFAEGKRWVGDQLNRITRMKPSRVDTHGAPPAMPGEREE